MRKVILGFGMTIDGYIARGDGSFDYLVLDKEGEELMAEFFATIDTTIMGRKTAVVQAKMQKDGEIPEMPDMPSVENYVFSRRWKPGKRKGFTVVNEPLAGFVRKLRKKPGKHIYLGGGGELARSFLKEDLVDELYLGIVPLLLGAGIAAFPADFPQRDFKLTECKHHSDGSVGLRYSRVKKGR